MENEIRSINKTLNMQSEAIVGTYNGVMHFAKDVRKAFKAQNRFNWVVTASYFVTTLIVCDLIKENAKLNARVKELEEAGNKEC